MEMMPIKPERKAEIEEYAQLHDQSAEEARDNLLAAQLDWERREYSAAVRPALDGYADIRAGRTKPGPEVHEAMRVKHGLSD